jgi:hypothetical protein
MNIFRSAKHRPRHLLLAYLLLPAILIAGLAVGGAAQAATRAVAAPSAATALKPCTFTNGKTSLLVLTHNGVVPQDGTIFHMPNNPQDTRCRDLNISYVSATDHYVGWLYSTKTHRWSPCHAGFVRITKGHHSTSHPPVLCTVVRGRTLMAVVTESGVQRNITVED